MGLFSKKQPVEVQVCGQPFECTACGNSLFWRRQAQLNTAVASFFDFDWANETAVCAVCSECGYIHWFMAN